MEDLKKKVAARGYVKDSYTAKAYQLDRDMNAKPQLEDFLNYIENRANALENVEQGHQPHPGNSSSKVAAVATTGATCTYCKSYEHKLFNCKKFQLLPANDRYTFAKEKKVCMICLGQHGGKCRFHFRCSECKKPHNTLLHCNLSETPPAVTLSSNVDNNVLLPTAKIKVVARDGTQYIIKALLDSGSQVSFITTKVVQLLGLTPLQSDTCIIGITNEKSNIKYCIPIEIHSLNSPFKTTVTCHVLKDVTCKLPQNKFDVSRVIIPPNIILADDQFNVPSEINMLLGADVFFQTLLPNEQCMTISLPSHSNQSSAVPRSAAHPPQQPSSTQLHVFNTYFGHIVGGNLPPKAVGREGVLSSAWSRELRCGRRLVSGLFSRPRLPLGYSYVATVPRGACRLNVTEIIPNDNYIALKITNGSYIMNGEFAVSAPGTYEAAGARFHYARDGSRDAVFAHGPIHHPIDIMILYTQPNPSIKYEYFTESLPGEVESEAVTKTDLVGVTPATFPATHFRRHHSYEMHSRKSIGGPRQPEISINPEAANADEIIVGNRKFMWKIMSYTQCTRTCGGGIQLGKYRCVEANPSKREVASTHCAGPTPPPSRRKCGTNACTPRWRAAAWTACPRCGPATRTRIVGCVQDHAKGITKISDQKCPLPKPSTSESCVIPDCNVQVGGEVRQITSKRVIKPRDHTDAFKEGPVYTVIVNNTVQDVGPAYSFSASTAGWIYTDWSECVGWCVGGGVQTRGVRCGESSGCSSKAPESKRPCQPKSECAPIDGNWFTGEWSPCSSPCRGKQIRGVLCIGGTGRHLKDTACRMPKPAHERDCSGDCKAMWHYGDWGQCSGNCNTSSSGIQLRTAVCSRGDSVTSDGECSQPRRATRICDLNCVVRPAAAAPKTIAVDIQHQQPLVIESQKASSAGTPQQRSISQRTKDHMTKGNCDDKLNNCFLAVQARLCNYNYYINNCCQSCAGR